MISAMGGLWGVSLSSGGGGLRERAVKSDFVNGEGGQVRGGVQKGDHRELLGHTTRAMPFAAPDKRECALKKGSPFSPPQPTR